MRLPRLFPHAPLACLLILCAAGAQPEKPLQVGPAADGATVVTTAQLIRPAGKVLKINGRPVDLALSPDAHTLYAKDDHGLLVIDVASWTTRQSLKFPSAGSSMFGITVSRDATHVYATDSANSLLEFAVAADAKVSQARAINLPGPDGRTGAAATGKGSKGTGHAFPCGVALSADDHTALVCLSRTNALGIVDLAAGELVEEIPVGVAPFAVKLSSDGNTAYVTNWGGRRPADADRTAPTSGTPALVDARGIAASGTVSIVDLKEKKEVAHIETGLSASGLELSADGRTLFVANANSDTVSIIDLASRSVTQQLTVRPDPALPFGSMPNGLALAPDGKSLYVSCAGNNALAVVRLGADTTTPATIAGFIPTGWYPGAVAARAGKLFVASIKGLGSRGKPDAASHRVQEQVGTFSLIDVPDAAALTTYTEQVRRDARVPQVLAALQRDAARKDATPVPVPRPSEPSVFDHVVYVIKENRTFDQVYGDMGKGNVEPKLCIFGREVTPNQHALAEQFALLDNFYCNGVCSADGHSWATEGNVTPYLERSFGGFHRSYTFGDDPLTYSSSGFVWDHVLAAGHTFRNYGEFDYAGVTPAASYKDVYDDFIAKTGKIKFTHRIGVETMQRYACPDYPGWDMGIPDVVRADIFMRELAEHEKSRQAGGAGTGGWFNFMIVYLPCDHTSGTSPDVPTPRSLVADNDLALGRVVEAISKSRFWPRTCIFVVEDDPQDGFDHVDGHRSGCLVISPYTKRGTVVSDFYNQASVVHTMERILGITAANQLYAAAPLMTACFNDTPDLTPFTAVPNQVPLAELNKKRADLPPAMQHWADESMELVLDKPDAINEDTLNRILWHAMRGPDEPYPAEWAGAHGRGLAALGLKIDTTVKPDDDDDDD